MQRIRKIAEQLSSNPVSNDSLKKNETASTKFYKPVKVLVTGAAGNIAYSILFAIGGGKLLGPKTPIELRLLDIEPMAKVMEGVAMELKDCAFPLLTKIITTTDYKTAFQDVQIALLIGARPRSKGMERADLLAVNAKIFEGQGQAIEEYADRNIKVCVVGNPANTNCLIAMQNAPSIPKENFTAMTRLDQNRAVFQLSERLKVPVGDIKNVIIWGNHSSTQYPDVNHAFIENFPSKNLRTTIKSAVNDDEWVKTSFLKKVQDRGAEIIQARGLSSAASAANACLDHVRDWFLGTRPGEWVSMAVPSDGSYGIPRGLVYSFPVTCSAGNYQIVHGLPIDKFSREKMDLTAKELAQEKEMALGK